MNYFAAGGGEDNIGTCAWDQVGIDKSLLPGRAIMQSETGQGRWGRLVGAGSVAAAGPITFSWPLGSLLLGLGNRFFRGCGRHVEPCVIEFVQEHGNNG